MGHHGLEMQAIEAARRLNGLEPQALIHRNCKQRLTHFERFDERPAVLCKLPQQLAYAYFLLFWIDKKILDGGLVFDRQNACNGLVMHGQQKNHAFRCKQASK